MVHENHNLTGDSIHLYGGGPCDSEGYEFYLSDYWAQRSLRGRQVELQRGPLAHPACAVTGENSAASAQNAAAAGCRRSVPDQATRPRS
ncbi:hypothetical protein [Streptomyces sp. NBC_00280]|uniref:hypothetical protein n=1 Tax=Streptomyces sp. NBC_00280 TaxID=2975699 RepID=UPI003250C427